MATGVICVCGHVEEGHEQSGQWDTFCAEFNELSCACIRYIPGKDFKCVCKHPTENHHLQETSVAYCEVFVLNACGCNEMRPIELRKGKVMLAQSEDTISDPWLAELKKPRKAALFNMLSIVVLGVTLSATGFSAVNVYAPTPQLQAQFIADTTTQYNATLTASAFFPNTYTINLISKKPIASPAGQAPCDLDKDIALMVQNSTWSYVYGFANGQQYERTVDLGTIASYLRGCSDPTNFKNASSTTWNADTCNVSLGNASMAIYQQNFSTPTVINLP